MSLDLNFKKSDNASPKLFIRSATGLVRKVSMLDAFLMNTMGMNVGLGAGLMFVTAPFLFPNGNMVLSVVLCALITSITLAYVYAQLSGAMPRAGGDYVFVSRIIHPMAGFMLSWSQTIWFFFWIGFNAWAPAAFVIPTVLGIMGTVFDMQVLLDYAAWISTPVGMIVTGSIINLAFTLMLIFGSAAYFKWQKWSFVFAALSIFIAVGLLFIKGGNFQANWDVFVKSAGGLRYTEVLAKAKELGFGGRSGGFSLLATISMMPFAFWSVGYCQGSAQIGGEVKSAPRTQFISMVGAVLINGAVLAIMGWALIRVAGIDFLASLGFLSNGHSDALGLPIEPFYNLLASILTTSPVLIILIGIGYLAWAINGTPLSMMQATRYMMAWSFDRLAPEKLGEVNPKTHSPVYGIILCAIMGEVSLIILTYVSMASLLSALVAQIIAFILVAFAAIFFPYRLKGVYNNSSKREVFGIPLITIAGIGTVLYLGTMLFIFLKFSAFGANSLTSLSISGGIFVLGFIYYLGYKQYQKSRGLDISLVFKEIPPE
jgi:amino acid transporter